MAKYILYATFKSCVFCFFKIGIVEFAPRLAKGNFGRSSLEVFTICAIPKLSVTMDVESSVSSR